MITIKNKHGQKCYFNGALFPVLGTPIIDKLFITVDYPQKAHVDIISAFIKLADEGYGVKTYKSAYKHNLKISNNVIGYEGEALLQCSPTKSGYNFFRLEMTPSRIDLNNLKTILDMTLPGGYDGVLKNGKVNRIDLTVDIENIKVAEIIARYPRMQVERHFSSGLKKQTKTLGSPKSSKSITLYDKKKQLQAYQSKKTDVFVNIPVGELTRLEISLKRTKATLAGITKLANPFKPLSLVAYPGCMSGKSYDPLWTLFLNVCEDCGEKTALAHLNKADQKIFKGKLTKEGKTDWWKPDYVWQEILAAIMGLKQVKGFTPTINGVIGNEPPPCE